ncbi:MAG: hypothetical protein LUF29_03240 [Oscillospiraceae bacterium]|nr:hypothetical protein [Oscillospiraceae bacterium]
MKRKILVMILSLCLIFSLTITVAGAVVHVHSLTHVEAQGATCTADGNSEYWYCSECGKYFSDAYATAEISLSDTVISAKGHSWGGTEYSWSSDMQTCTAKRTCQNDSSHVEVAYATVTSVVKKAATCTAYGEITYTGSFSVDWATEQQRGGIIQATGHSYEAVVTAPTCTETGYTTYTCSVCGDTYTADETNALGHSYEAVVTEPTCTENGYTTYTCSVCGDTYTADETNALGHSYEAVVTAPTCTETGYTTYTCSVCGDTYTADETNALGHSYVDTVTAPTCTEEGYTTHTCSVCGDSYDDTYTSALGHKHELSGFTWSEDLKTATAEFVCSTCGNSETVAATITGEGHLGVSVHTATVVFNGETYSVSVTTGTTVTVTAATAQEDSEEVSVDAPVEDSTTESESEEPEETPVESNPTTGMVVALLPMVIAMAAIGVGKRR